MLSKHTRILTLLLFSLCLQTVAIHAEVATTSKGVLSGHPHLEALLREEMLAVQQAMNRIVNAIPQGDWSTVAMTAKAIHDSFIFAQKLTPKDRETLHHTLPPEFVQLDEGLHLRAARLHDAATARDAELSTYYVSRMLESCVQCHQKYATHRFPALIEKQIHAPAH